MPRFDVVIVGAGIAGPALAHRLSTLPRAKKCRIALLERSLAEPDRIVGELLQPAGITALRQLRLEKCLEGLDAIPSRGYCILHDGRSVYIPYPDGYEGRSFHHGRFVMSLRAAANRAENVELIEATATELIEHGSRIVGVKATRKIQQEECKEEYWADLVIVADGCFSNFRNSVMGCALAKPVARSSFCGAILEDVTLPTPTAVLVQGSGPVLMYQISEHCTRILISIQHPLPTDLKVRYYPFFLIGLTLISTVAYPLSYLTSNTNVIPCSYPKSVRQRPYPTHAMLLPPSSLTRLFCIQGWCHPHW